MKIDLQEKRVLMFFEKNPQFKNDSKACLRYLEKKFKIAEKTSRRRLKKKKEIYTKSIKNLLNEKPYLSSQELGQYKIAFEKAWDKKQKIFDKTVKDRQDKIKELIISVLKG